MPVATTCTVSLDGAVGHVVTVQADVSSGMVRTDLVGRVDQSLNEARDRVRMAITNSNLPWPGTKRITVLLAPADLRKRGPHHDRGIALAVLGAEGALDPVLLKHCLYVGELMLDGSLRSVRGVLPMVLAARDRGITTVMVPEPQLEEARMVPGTTVYGVRSLAQAVAVSTGDPIPEAPPVVESSAASLLQWRGSTRHEDLDLDDVLGMGDARLAMEVAAAGGHHLLLSGPKGAGKTTLAERLPSILPDLSDEESLELTAIHSLAGTLDPGKGMLVRPPYSAPHHDASKVSIVGGGSGQVRPGELSRTHSGVLFLDEFPLFRSDVVEAANPCPCGDHKPHAKDDRCRCRPQALREYRAKLSGPVADRIDITRHVEPLAAHERADRFAPREDSATVRARVARARARQAERYAQSGWRLNGHATGAALRDHWPLTDAATALLDSHVVKGALTSRGAVRVHRMAWTVHDLAEEPSGRPGVEELDVALRLRTGAPLLASSVGRRSA